MFANLLNNYIKNYYYHNLLMNDIIEHFQNKGYIFYNYFKYIIYKLWNYNKLIIYLNYSFNDYDNNTFFYKLYIKLLLIYINFIYAPNIKKL